MKVTITELDNQLSKLRQEQKTLKSEVKELRLDINPEMDIENNINEKESKKAKLEFDKSNNELSFKFEVKKEIYDRNNASISSKKKDISALETEIDELEKSKTQPKEQNQSGLTVNQEKENRFLRFVKSIFNRNQKIMKEVQPELKIERQEIEEIEQQISKKKTEIKDINGLIDSLEKENVEIRKMRSERTEKLEKESKEIQRGLEEIDEDIQKLNDERKTILENAPKISKEQKEAKRKVIESKRKKIDENMGKIDQIQKMQKEIDPSRYPYDGVLPNNYFSQIYKGKETIGNDEIITKVIENSKQPKKDGLEITDEEHKKIFGGDSGVPEKNPKSGFSKDLQKLVEPDDNVVKKVIDKEERHQNVTLDKEPSGPEEPI